MKACPNPREINIDLWVTKLTIDTNSNLIEKYKKLLSKEELRRWDKYLFENDKRDFLVSRALVRSVLGRLIDRDPRELKFLSGPKGKPYLLDDRGLPHSLNFNLSHTKGMAILAVSSGSELGVDIENTARHAPLEVAKQYFSPSESAEMFAYSTAIQHTYFWRLWTLKESYIKATGNGLSVALDEPIFSVYKNRIKQCNRPDTSKQWWFAQWWPSSIHLASLCVERQPNSVLGRIVFHETIPLESNHVVQVEFESTSDWGAKID